MLRFLGLRKPCVTYAALVFFASAIPVLAQGGGWSFSIEAAGAADFNDAGLKAYRQGRYDEARAAYGRAFWLLQEENAENSEEFARLLKNEALLRLETGDFRSAIQANTEALRIEKSLPDAKPGDRATTLNNLGVALCSAGRIPEAEAAYRESIELHHSSQVVQGSDLASALNNLAMLERETGRLEDAHRHALEALTLAKGSGAELITGAIFNSLGVIAVDRNKLHEAKAYLDRAAAIWLRTAGPEHPSYATALSNLGLLSNREGHHKEAQKLFERALAINEARFGPAHPQVGFNLGNIAVELYHRKRFDEAVTHFQRAEEIEERVYGAGNLQVANLWRNMGVAYAASKRLEESEAALRKAIECRKTAAGMDDPTLSLWLREYANVLRRQQRYGQAEQAEVDAERIEVRNTVQAQKQGAGAGAPD
jgi:tetratricopeptide (TPR) repeat protein